MNINDIFTSVKYTGTIAVSKDSITVNRDGKAEVYRFTGTMEKDDQGNDLPLVEKLS